MSIKDLTEAFKLIQENPNDADFMNGCSDELINKAEQVLDINFPQTYKVFLKKYGAGDIAGQEFYGVIDEDFENSSIPDAIWLTLHDREKYNFPKHLLIISQTSDGYYYVLDCSKMKDEEEGAVYEWNPNISKENDTLVEVAKDYGEFILNLIKSSL